jgi:outer membrane receptor protein involved in Fe transport
MPFACLRARLLLAATAFTASLGAQTAPANAPAAARPAAPATESVKLEAFAVTGSHLRRSDVETALPVTVIDAAELDLRGAATLAELFETLGIAEPSAITELNVGPQDARGDVASIDLRGLGSGSTLMLINGRRMAPHPISMAENGVPSLAPNINSLPRALISQVEILRDGASAIYGADAAAGVINNLVSRSFTGRRLTLRGSMTQHGGANEAQATLAQGFRHGPWQVAVSLDFFHRDALSASQRKWSRESDLRLTRNLPAPWNGLPLVDANGTTVRDNDFDNSQAVGSYAQWQRGFIQPDFLTFVGSRPAGNAGISTAAAASPVLTLSANGTWYAYPGSDGALKFKPTAPSRNLDSEERLAYRNGGKWRILVPKTDRWQFATFVDRPVNDRLDFFADLLVYRARTRSGRPPVDWDNVGEPGLYVPATNPWNPFGTRFYHPTGQPNADGTPRLTGTPADVAMVGGLMLAEARPRVLVVDSHAARAVAGLRGRLAGDWQWESALLVSGAQTHEYEYFFMRESLLRRALGRTDATALNPFGTTFRLVNGQLSADRPYVNPAGVLDPLYFPDERFGRTGLYAWDAKVTGRFGRAFRGGPIGLASGVEVRHETYQDQRPVYSGRNPPGAGAEFPFLREEDNDIIALSPNVPIDARQTILAAYAEVALPFVTPARPAPLIDALELTLAGRFERFSIHGQTTTPKATLVWKPARWLKLRGAYNESFRAPNLVQTNVSPLRRNISAADPYRSEVTGLPGDGAVNRRTFRQGNQNLRPETATSWVTGFVLDVPKVSGLSVTFDYWRISQRDVLANIGAPATLLRDELALDLATQAALAAGQPLDQIDLGSGTAGYQGYGKVTRAPVTAADRAAYAAYNARQSSNATRRAPVGDFVSLVDDYLNLGRRDLEGYELGLRWRLPRSRLGQFTLGGDATRYLRREEQEEAGDPFLSSLGRNGRARWRASGSLAWRREGWSAAWFTSYYGTFVDTSAATTEAVYRALGAPRHIQVFNDNGITRYLLRVAPMITHNANVGYRWGAGAPRWLDGAAVRLQVNNVLDREPSLADETNGYVGGTSHVRGRQFALEISRRF